MPSPACGVMRQIAIPHSSHSETANMASTSYGVNDPLSNKLWAKKLSAEALKETYFGKFMGTSSDSMIYMKSESSTNAGDAVTSGLRMQLSGDGVTESQTLMGNEESLTTYSDKVVLNELAHAVRVRNKNTIDAQRVPFSLRDEAKMGLKDWFANRFDTAMFNHLAGNTLVTDGRYSGSNTITAPSAGRIFRAGAATDDAAINADSTKVFDLKVIDGCVERAGTASPPDPADQGGGREQIPDVPARLPGDGSAHQHQLPASGWTSRRPRSPAASAPSHRSTAGAWANTTTSSCTSRTAFPTAFPMLARV